MSSPPPLPASFLPDHKKDLTDSSSTITAREITETIMRSNPNSAMGQERVPYKMLKHVMDANQDILIYLFNNLIRYGILPKPCIIAIGIPIPNLGRADLSTSKNLPPISLLSCLANSFQKNPIPKDYGGRKTDRGHLRRTHRFKNSTFSHRRANKTLTQALEWLLQNKKVNKMSKGADPT